MNKKLIPLLFLLLFSGCNEQNKKDVVLDGKKLLETKCASCHNLDIPPYTYPEEKAPPMMAVAFHIYDFIEASDESQKFYKSIEFVADYVRAPDIKKSFCDKESLKLYGLMPSQKEKVTKEEVKAIAKYIFQHFTKENLLIRQKQKAEFDALPAGKKVALKHKCLSCHRVDKKIIGPSFQTVAKKYSENKEIINSIKNGSKGKYKSSKGAIMPAFKSLSDEELYELSEWILNS